MEKEKNNKRKKIILTTLGVTILVGAAGFIAYKKVPKIKKIVDETIKGIFKKEVVVTEENISRVNTKPYGRKYENYKGKKY